MLQYPGVLGDRQQMRTLGLLVPHQRRPGGEKTAGERINCEDSKNIKSIPMSQELELGWALGLSCQSLPFSKTISG